MDGDEWICIFFLFLFTSSLPNAGFSKRMQPHVDELARRTRHLSTFTVLKIDETRNDVGGRGEGLSIVSPFCSSMFPCGRLNKTQRETLPPPIAPPHPEPQSKPG